MNPNYKMNYKKYLIGFATLFFATSFAQNTRFTLDVKVNKIYSEIKNNCGKDIELLNSKYQEIAKESSDKNLSQKDYEEYLKQFEVLKNSYTDCISKNQLFKIEKLRALLAKVAEENKKQYTPPKNTLLPIPETFSEDVLRKKLYDLLAGDPLFENLENTLRLELTFILDEDGQTKDAIVTGTDNEEIKLYTVLKFYSISDIYKPLESNGRIVKRRYRLPLTFLGL